MMEQIVKIFRGYWLLLILSLIVFSMLLSLGFWQLKRLTWKEELLATIETRIASSPSSLEEILTKFHAGEDVEYMPVYIEGNFQHSFERHFYATNNGVPGWYVFTPLQFESSRIIFVNRGFVPVTLKLANQRKESLIGGQVEVTGLVRVPPEKKPNFFTPDNQLEDNEFYWRNLKEMISSISLPTGDQVEPLFIDAKPNPNLVYPQGGTTLIKLPNNHLQYAITWFGLALILVAVCSSFLWSKLKEY